MRNTGAGVRWWWIGGAVISLTGAVLLARQAIDEQRALFETDARIVHRLLSQQVVQHDAILDTLALLQPGPEAPGATPPEQRLPALYPHILSVQRRDRGGDWPDPALAGAETASRQHQRPALATVELDSGRYRLVLAAEPTAYALGIDLRAMVPWAEWPMKPETSPVRVRLDHAGQSFTLQPGDPTALNTGRGWRFEFHKHLAAQSQPFDVVASRQMGWHELPWGRMLAWLAAVALVLTALAQWQGQRAARRRAEELLRLGQVARLNTLGELAAGMAHELNQPLTAVLANTQAAQRLLADEPPELDTARTAMAQATAQARRAADVVGRLRRAVERPDVQGGVLAVDLAEAVRRALYLLEPECQRRSVVPQLQAVDMVTVAADPVALDQIVHNLLMNALQALEGVDVNARRLSLSVSRADGQGELIVTDSGPGLAPEVLPRLFEPFFSTRAGGLGLGLSLCETLASGMGGSLTATNGPQGGAEFRLRLPLKDAE
ncbi:MAG: two-component sensor histidine kinase [Burkholderiales bacterium RIFCSPHIGHO2_02_FULL_66_10]|nr:MAG: two-component sensor histidine kinase [Burkholderiales bacterium RIFCSPHIGHO2_02_FULL_66_10]OGB27894.1 MAG: two-component sensor histidine kinase [Burkholderiales bacterium RIFCSPLOWO2_02_FULL_66_35]